MFSLATVKPQLGILVPVALVALPAWRTIAATTVTAVLVGVVTTLVLGWEVWRVYAATVAPLQAQILATGEGLFTWMPSAFMAARVLRWPHAGAYAVQALFALVAVAATYWTFRRFRHAGGLPLAVFLLATAVATPYVHSDDLPTTAYAVLLILSNVSCDGRAFYGERAVLSMLWFFAVGRHSAQRRGSAVRPRRHGGSTRFRCRQGATHRRDLGVQGHR